MMAAVYIFIIIFNRRKTPLDNNYIYMKMKKRPPSTQVSGGDMMIHDSYIP